MIRFAIFIIPSALLLAACGSSEYNPLTTFGIIQPEKPHIEYTPRPPLVIPPEDQRSQLPVPQDTVAQAPTATPAQAQTQAVAPPQSYEAPAPQQADAPAEDKPWWTRIFGT